MCHEKARNGMFARQSFEEKSVVGSYYRSLAYADLEKNSQGTRRYREKYTQIAGESFCKSALKSSYVASDSKEQRHQVWAVSAPFYVMRKINDAR